MTSSRAAEFVSKLALQPHPEGGWYREIYRSPTRVETARGSRSALTTIYYLLEQNQLSRWHVVQADELWHFYAGAPLELLAYSPVSRKLARRVLGEVVAGAAESGGRAAAADVAAAAAGTRGRAAGADTDAGVATGTADNHVPAADAAGRRRAADTATATATPVAVIPTDVWQAARSLGEYTLVGCTVGPGFEFADFQFVSELPSHRDHFTGDLAAFTGLL